MRSFYRTIFVTVVALALWLQPGFVAAQGQGGEALATTARLAAEGLAIGSPSGAGGDPQTSVAQPVFSAGRAAEVTTSFQPLLGPVGDPGGYRAFLERRGITFGLIAVAETYRDVRGGLRRGSTGLTLLDLDVDVDLETLAGWKGITAHATVYQIQGSGTSRSRVGNLMTISEIEALPASRLSELWLEQSLFDDQLFLRVGQLSADTEYMVSQTSILFTNGTFGWPAIFAANMTDGGPAYPLSAPTVRLKYVPTREFSFQASLIDGTPGGGNPRSGVDPQRRNPNGTRFPLSDPPLAIAEVSYAYNARPGDTGLPGTVTFGGWHRFGRVDASMPDPVSGLGRRVTGDSGIYGLIDQTIYQEPNDPNDGASVFLRASASPGDRNLVDLYLDGGVAYRGLFPGRSDDTLGFGVGIAHISPAARRLDAIAAFQSSTPTPRRSAEILLEATYQAVLAPGIALQPTLQYVVQPGGGIANPRDPDGKRVRNATVFGLRAITRY
ncbi:carbohydrate porin [Methylobacterium sp. ARG-1]|uniref:carbohydrate porin n=1 Tax=Methylobacterium sp. ARG-1 TaxID=1692501 RepID=UPI00067FA2C8|nr:carbohydrate porin [Methylobacterium sp. ARG-1]